MVCYYLSRFMSGQLKFTDTYVSGKMGIYIINVTQNLKPRELVFYCEKTETGNDWECDGREITVLATSTEIDEILSKKPHW